MIVSSTVDLMDVSSTADSGVVWMLASSVEW